MAIRISGLPPVVPALESNPGAQIGGATGLGQGTAGVSKALSGGHPARPFTDFLNAQLSGVNATQVEADKAVEAMVTGQSSNIHEMMIALDKADTSLRMLGQVRNKVVEAYREMMRMGV